MFPGFDPYFKIDGELLREDIKSQGLTQTALADEVGINSTYFSKQVRGERPIRLSKLKEICLVLKTRSWWNYLGTDADDLIALTSRGLFAYLEHHAAALDNIPTDPEPLSVNARTFASLARVASQHAALHGALESDVITEERDTITDVMRLGDQAELDEHKDNVRTAVERKMREAGVDEETIAATLAEVDQYGADDRGH